MAASAAMLLVGCSIEQEEELAGDVAIDETYEEELSRFVAPSAANKEVIMLEGDVEYIGEDSEE